MAGLAACTALQELYLSHNGVGQLEVSVKRFQVMALQTCCFGLHALAMLFDVSQH